MEGWPGSLEVGGGEDSWGVGGVGVRTTVREFGICDDGGGVIDDVVGGAGEVNLARSGELALDMEASAEDSEGEMERSLGVVGLESSVEGRSESWDVWDKDAWASILPRRTDTSEMQAGHRRALFAFFWQRERRTGRRLPVGVARRRREETRGCSLLGEDQGHRRGSRRGRALSRDLRADSGQCGSKLDDGRIRGDVAARGCRDSDSDSGSGDGSRVFAARTAGERMEEAGASGRPWRVRVGNGRRRLGRFGPAALAPSPMETPPLRHTRAQSACRFLCHHDKLSRDRGPSRWLDVDLSNSS